MAVKVQRMILAAVALASVAAACGRKGSPSSGAAERAREEPAREADASGKDAGAGPVAGQEAVPDPEPTEALAGPAPKAPPAGPGPAEPSQWPQWRGPLGTGASPDADPPVEWGEGRNVRWKTRIPGRGHSSPVVWKDRVFLTTAVETDAGVAEETVKAVEAATPDFHRGQAHMPRKVLRFVVMALDRKDGGVLWERTVREEAPHAATHADGSWASGSPVTDGERVYAYFGSHGLYCLGVDGDPKWERRLGTFEIKANFGEGTSPALYGETLVVNQDHEGASFIVALDSKTGEERWRRGRDEVTSWSTPLVVEHDGRPQAVVSATGRIRGYDAASGEVVWEAGGMTGNVIPSPVAGGGMVFCMSGFRGNALLAIRLASARGDVTGSPDAVAWSRGKGTPYAPSPLLYDGLLHFLGGNEGKLTCADASTGAEHYGGRTLEGIGSVYSSPVGAAGRVYVTGRRGVTVVLKSGPAFEVLARNKLDDSFTASAALVGGDLFLRGYGSLYCIADGGPERRTTGRARGLRWPPRGGLHGKGKAR